MPCINAIGQCYPDYEFTPETFEKLYCSDKFPYDDKLKDWVRKLVHQSAIETIPSSINPAQFDEPAIPFDKVTIEYPHVRLHVFIRPFKSLWT